MEALLLAALRACVQRAPSVRPPASFLGLRTRGDVDVMLVSKFLAENGLRNGVKTGSPEKAPLAPVKRSDLRGARQATGEWGIGPYVSIFAGLLLKCRQNVCSF